MPIVAALLCGLVFGLGLLISGMADPARVLGFLDLAGAWNPSLALVMAGALAVGLPTFALLKKRPHSLLGEPMRLPTARQIDLRLIGGSLLFGIGWGLAGICPGPALVLVGAGVIKGIGFALAMLAGMAIFELIERARRRG